MDHDRPVAGFRIEVESGVPAPEAWRRVLDLRMHSRVIPLTTVTGAALSADGLEPGSRFVARTAVGPVGFDDPMVVDDLTRPAGSGAGAMRIRKEGKVIRGQIDLRVVPSAAGSLVVWQQDICVRGFPRVLDRVVVGVARRAYAAAIRRLLARG